MEFRILFALLVFGSPSLAHEYVLQPGQGEFEVNHARLGRFWVSGPLSFQDAQDYCVGKVPMRNFTDPFESNVDTVPAIYEYLYTEYGLTAFWTSAVKVPNEGAGGRKFHGHWKFSNGTGELVENVAPFRLNDDRANCLSYRPMERDSSQAQYKPVQCDVEMRVVCDEWTIPVLFAAGGYTSSTEVVGPPSPSLSCPSLPHLPAYTGYAASFEFRGDPVLCGTEGICYIYKPGSNTWVAHDTPVPAAREGTAAALLGEDYIITGGGWQKTTSIFISATGDVVPGPDLPLNLTFHSAVTVSPTEIAVVGGRLHTQAKTAFVGLYNSETDRWVDLPRLNKERSRHVSFHLNGKLVAAGGDTTGAHTRTVEILDDVYTSTAWRYTNSLPRFFTESSLVYFRGKYHVAGGYYYGFIFDIYEYNEASETFSNSHYRFTLWRTRAPIVREVNYAYMNCVLDV